MSYKASHKYKAKKTIIDGIVFDSKKEANRYQELILLLRAKEISNLELQKAYELIPNQYGPDIISPRGKKKRGPLLERKCIYIADFVYKDKSQQLTTYDYRLRSGSL